MLALAVVLIIADGPDLRAAHYGSTVAETIPIRPAPR
jgi:hypothetical protein